MTHTIHCAKCGGEMQVPEGQVPRLCPYCGSSLTSPSVSPLEERLRAERDPKRKYRIIQETLAASPDDFDANKALLFHGRLHEPMRKALDFSILKCHLLTVFDTPDEYSPQGLDDKYEELLQGPQLRKTMALAPDADAFFAEYLHRLAREYVDLFIRGDSKVAHAAFGFPRSQDSVARICADRVSRMLRAVAVSDRLDANTRLLLRQALLDGFSALFPGQPDRLITD